MATKLFSTSDDWILIALDLLHTQQKNNNFKKRTSEKTTKKENVVSVSIGNGTALALKTWHSHYRYLSLYFSWYIYINIYIYILYIYMLYIFIYPLDNRRSVFLLSVAYNPFVFRCLAVARLIGPLLGLHSRRRTFQLSSHLIMIFFSLSLPFLFHFFPFPFSFWLASSSSFITLSWTIGGPILRLV